MLPLWIIDLREKSDRRDHFEKLLGKIDHVYSVNTCSEPEGPEQVYASSIENTPESSSNGYDSDVTSDNKFESTLHEQLEAIDKQNADKESIIEGNYWRYSRMADYFYGISISSNGAKRAAEYDRKHIRFNVEDKPTARGTAQRLYAFQCDLIEEGQNFIKQLRESNAHPDIKINIVILGDITEDFTRIVFPAIAGILQKEKGRILPHHIHQGMEVIGMLYIPSDINTLHVDVRRSMQRTLNEIDVQYRINDIRGYDHMMLYQNVQNRTECAYQILNDEQLAEYLIQCIVHLYLACNDSHPLLSGTTAADVFYFSMGATSVHFDTENEDLKGRHKFALGVIKSFKSEGDDEKEIQNFDIIGADDYQPESFFKFEVISKLDWEDIEEEEPSPHPIRNFMAKFLKRYYYNLYLRFFTIKMMQQVINRIDNSTRASLETISSDSKRRFADARKKIFENLRDIIGRISANDGGIPTIIRKFKEMQDNLSGRRKNIQSFLDREFWKKIEQEHISNNLIDRFVEYHDAYSTDIKNKTGGSNQQEMKKQAVNELNGILSKESTTLSRICRSVLLGLMCALAFVPILDFLSPYIIDLGNIKRNCEWWSMGLFFLPALFQLFAFWRYNRSKRRAINNLKAMYLHDAYARVANRIESEINSFYDKMIALSERYINRCENIRKELGKDLNEDEQCKPLFRQSMFNQPLIGGKYGRDYLLPEKEADDAELRINYIRYKLSEISKREHFLFINQNKNIIMDLFRDVELCENLIRRVKDNGEEELVTKEQQEKEQLAAWNKHKQEFLKNLRSSIKDAFLPREDATVGEKLHHYCSSTPDKIDVLKPMIAFAATNGELTSSADMEYTDAKMNDKRVENYILPYISSASNQMQSDKYNKVYGKYIFITRWRCFEHFSLNRILPTEDFDEKVRKQCVYEEEIKVTGKKKANRSMEEEKIRKEHHEGENYIPKTSSLLLWALCPDDSSSEWFKLFNSEFFAEAYSDKNTYREILNQND